MPMPPPPLVVVVLLLLPRFVKHELDGQQRGKYQRRHGSRDGSRQRDESPEVRHDHRRGVRGQYQCHSHGEGVPLHGAVSVGVAAAASLARRRRRALVANDETSSSSSSSRQQLAHQPHGGEQLEGVRKDEGKARHQVDSVSQCDQRRSIAVIVAAVAALFPARVRPSGIVGVIQQERRDAPVVDPAERDDARRPEGAHDEPHENHGGHERPSERAGGGPPWPIRWEARADPPPGCT
mmetsp:Transcript_8498/g.25671  ORF Transcript_8498/g.25671 Transcript_8498/m.25671 type:complete len:237 (+) Transcript_8498:644-1354(+)